MYLERLVVAAPLQSLHVKWILDGTLAAGYRPDGTSPPPLRPGWWDYLHQSHGDDMLITSWLKSCAKLAGWKAKGYQVAGK